MEVYADIKRAVMKGIVPEVKKQTEGLLAEGIGAEDILNNGLIPGMMEIGVLFKQNKVFVPEVMLAARAMYTGLDILKPILAQNDYEAKGKVIIGTVQGDMHDIGKNLVAMMMEGAGLEVVDLGTDVAADQFVAAIKEHVPDIVAMSALLTTTMPMMKKTIDAITAEGLRGSVKIMVGGAPVTADYAREIGADAYTPDAGAAAQKALELIG
jgi:5-methyltetrahydrofolate--homocysteine methyltransferase